MTKHQLFLPLILTFCLVILMVASVGMWNWSHALHAPPAASQSFQPAPLMVIDSAPIGLIGTVTVIGTSTVTISGMPAGNTLPVVLTVLVDATTSITKVGPAPDYATSTATFSDFTKGMLLNISATAEEKGLRHAERIIIPPPQQ